MYKINKVHFYYEGTLNTPKDGAILDDNQQPILFESIDEAVQYLKEQNVTNQLSKQSFQFQGTYVLFHGEYSRPRYNIRKTKYASWQDRMNLYKRRARKFFHENHGKFTYLVASNTTKFTRTTKFVVLQEEEYQSNEKLKMKFPYIAWKKQ